MALGRGIHLKLVDAKRFEANALATIISTLGCAAPTAHIVAQNVAAGGHKTTVKPSVNLAKLRNDCATLGVIVIEIPPRRV